MAFRESERMKATGCLQGLIYSQSMSIQLSSVPASRAWEYELTFVLLIFFIWFDFPIFQLITYELAFIE